jgi:hypothetical protein
MKEESEDIFPGFVEIARATGGTADNSRDPVSAFKHAADSSSDYYLLSYSPENYSPDGGFRTIEVRLKRGGYQVSSLLGYYAK